MASGSRRWLWKAILTVVVMLAGAAWLLTPRAINWVVRARLQALVANQLDATLRIGGLAYHAPYGVSVSNASLIANGPGGKPLELLRMPKLDLVLAQSPLARGPILIQSLVIGDPSIHLVQTRDGIVGRRARANVSPGADGGAVTPMKLSDILRLTHFELQRGQVLLEDQTHPGAAPLVWKGINIDLDTDRESASRYGFRLAVDNAPLAHLGTAGSLDVDDLLLRLSQCTLDVHVDADAPESALSAQMQAPLRKWETHGALTINTTGTVPLRRLTDSSFQSTIELHNGRARIPGWKTPIDRLDLKIELADGSQSTAPGLPPAAPGQRPTVRIEHMAAACGDASISLRDALALADSASQTWTLSSFHGRLDPGASKTEWPVSVRALLDQLHPAGAIELALEASGPLGSIDPGRYKGRLELTPQSLSLRPSGLDTPITEISPMSISVADGVATIQGIRGDVEGNLLFLKQARVKLADFPRRIHASDLSGCLTFGRGGKYPALLAAKLDACRPAGPFFFSGSIDYDGRKRAQSLDYNVRVHTSRGRLSLMDQKLDVTDIDTVVDLTPAGAVISRFQASTLGGSASLTGTVGPGERLPYQCSATLRNVDLRELGRLLTRPGQPPPPLSGRGVVTADLKGEVPPGKTPAYMGLGGTGEFEILGGDFWRIPLMKSIAQSVSRQSLTVGEAAGQFQIRDGVVHFDRAVASAPALGVEGSGDVDFNGNLKLSLVADVLGDWGERARDIGDGGGVAKLLGKVQKGVNVATRAALYEVHVSGDSSNPKATAVLVPFLTRQATHLLGAAADKSRKTGLLQAIHETQNAK